MSDLKKISIKLLLLVPVLVASNYLYKWFVMEDDIQANSDIINLVRDVQDSSEVIYFGESSNFSFRDDDIDKRAISQFISLYYPDKRFGTINKGALHAGIYLDLLKTIPEDAPLETIIITLNLRSFDAPWIHSELETALQKSVVLLKQRPPIINRFALSFKAYDIKTDKERNKQVKKAWLNDKLEFPYAFDHGNTEEWIQSFYHSGYINPDGVRDDALTQLGTDFIRAYAFQIDPESNPRIKDFDNIVKLAKSRRWNIVFNLMAENTQKAELLVGDDLIFLMKQNRDFLVQRYSEMGVIVVDNLDLVDDDQYIDQNWTTEHYAEKGRKQIAANVAIAMKQVYPDHYKDVDLTIDKKANHFINDCEGQLVWLQHQTLTDEKAFSGKKSSKSDNESPYSLTLAWSVENMDTSLLDTLRFSAMFYYTSELNSPDIVCEFSGENMQSIYQPIELNNLISPNEKWQKAEWILPLPQACKDAELVKVYIFNPHADPVFIDDLDIEFR